MPSRSVVYLSLINDTEFSDQYARAREAQLEGWADEIVAISDDPSIERVQEVSKADLARRIAFLLESATRDKA